MTKPGFLLPSLIGILVFLTPIPWNARITIGIGVVTDWIKGLTGACRRWLIRGAGRRNKKGHPKVAS
jgi:nucleoside recognition membrane protein YjiH